MGRRDRERIARIQAGEEVAISAEEREKATNRGVAVLQKLTLGQQIDALSTSAAVGTRSPAAIRKALEANAPKEMRKGADKLARKNKPVTVDALLKEYRSNKKFQEMAAGVGLDEMWFMALAEKECARRENDGA